MLTEHTHLKNASQTGDSNATNETVVIGKSNIYQYPLLIIAGSLLAFLVLIVAAGQMVVSIYNHLHMRLPMVQWHLQIIKLILPT